ncbi:hypothetical protein [Burkholderia pyrrocinia]|uniref:hypothetical protein n=1 Tax=Burkholderia pyrrocinia TaxID=60550 RepID=UPI00158CD97B|nr:hypothetical protein [Burkholderia pyrrocinia]
MFRPREKAAAADRQSAEKGAGKEGRERIFQRRDRRWATGDRQHIDPGVRHPLPVDRSRHPDAINCPSLGYFFNGGK